MSTLTTIEQKAVEKLAGLFTSFAGNEVSLENLMEDGGHVHDALVCEGVLTEAEYQSINAWDKIWAEVDARRGR